METSKKQGRYMRMQTQLAGLLTKTNDPVARMATISAILYHKMDYFFWCGFYRVQGEQLIVGPYQGPAACQVLEGRGVCLSAVQRDESVIVPDVEQFPGHIACDSRAKSEIVIPVRDSKGQVMAVLDVDSSEIGSFDQIDREHLEKIVEQVFNT